MTTSIKQGVIEGLAAHGADGQGLNGFPGFVFYLASRHPKSACRLVERLLPPAVVVAGSESGNTTFNKISIVSIPSGQFLSREEYAKATQPLSLQIEAEAIHDVEPENFERDYIEPEPAPERLETFDEPAPMSEDDRIMQQARAMGYTPLPPRSR